MTAPYPPPEPEAPREVPLIIAWELPLEDSNFLPSSTRQRAAEAFLEAKKLEEASNQFERAGRLLWKAKEDLEQLAKQLTEDRQEIQSGRLKQEAAEKAAEAKGCFREAAESAEAGRKLNGQNIFTGVFFLDTHAAYYRMVRDLTLGCIYSDTTIVKLFRRFSLDAEDLAEMLFVIEEGGTLADAQVPDAIRHAAKDVHHWTCPHPDGAHIAKTEAGSRPGESWADLVFSFRKCRVLAKIAELARGEGLLPELCHDAALGAFAMPDDGVETYGQDAMWADDSAWPIRDRSPDSLVGKATRLASLVLSQCMSQGDLEVVRRIAAA
eukprot:s4277_g2.t1